MYKIAHNRSIRGRSIIFHTNCTATISSKRLLWEALARAALVCRCACACPRVPGYPAPYAYLPEGTRVPTIVPGTGTQADCTAGYNCTICRAHSVHTRTPQCLHMHMHMALSARRVTPVCIPVCIPGTPGTRYRYLLLHRTRVPRRIAYRYRYPGTYNYTSPALCVRTDVFVPFGITKNLMQM